MREKVETEEQLKNAKSPWPKTKVEINEYIESLLDIKHDYGTCVYAMSLASEAAFNYVASVLGCSGFQASCADLDFLRRTRRIDGPFMIIKAEDALFPQHDLPARLAELLEEWRPWIKEQAQKNLRENLEHVHPEVKAHWQKLAE